MLKKILKLGLFVLLMSIIFGMFLYDVEQYSIRKVNNFFEYTNNYSPIKTFGKISNVEENKKFTKIIKDVSKENNLFFLKRVVNESYSIKEGINFSFLPFEEITLYTPNVKKNRKYQPPLGISTLSIESIDSDKAVKELEGQFFLKTMNRNKYNKAINEIRERFNEEFKTNYSFNDFADFEKKQSFQLGIDTDMYNIKEYLKIGIIFLFVMLSFWVVSSRVKIKILRSNGYSLISIANNLIGKRFFGIIIVILALIEIFTRMNNLGFLSSIFKLLFVVYLWIIFMLTLTVKLNKKNGKTSLWLNNGIPIVVKTIFLILLVVASLDLTSIIVTASGLSLEKEVPQEIRKDNYYVYFPIVVGKNSLEFEHDHNYENKGKPEIYRFLNKKGSLIVNIKGYEFEANQIFGRDIKLNPNYLKKFALYDVNGNRVQIKESEKKRILLIPERIKKNHSELEKIKKYYYQDLKKFENKQTKIIYIKDNQPIYTFVPKKPWIDDYPILNILTTSNSSEFERESFNGDEYPPLKVKTKGLSMTKLKSLIKKNNLKDNLLSFIPFEKAEVTLIKQLSGSFTYLISSFMLTFFSFVIVCVLTTIYYFNSNERKFHLLRLNGYSFFGTYNQVFFGIIGEIALGILLTTIMSKLSKELVINMLVAILLDFLIVCVTLLIIEKKNQGGI
ncbi:DUF1430 domain-containing protein [Xylocopilactobacillus apis]|uniref:Bacteriocin-associated integral membrane protein n=1 Tax=Xylocopilactobacillus apis TaxID=2932183 RepID=A0AAU9CPV8_9LACO|nr:DUF1430 domain-containing protein [Xylocopilactobacillus apis]BDR55979.1 bacteriocin-associated integral membrane protein [Xylocopilactobacillus apis]